MRMASANDEKSGFDPRRKRRQEMGMLMAELFAALAIFSLLVLTIAAPLSMDQSMVRQAMHRAIAMQIVDGEMEVLAAGAWRSYEEGERDFLVTCKAVESLPKGKFVLTVNGQKLRLQWREFVKDGREVVRVEREFRRPQ